MAIICKNCSAELPKGTTVCPSCEAVLSDPKELKRKKINRPTLEEKYQVVSNNFNGKFHIKKAPDGSYVCTCPSFLLQNGTQNGDNPFSTCKHIRDYLSQNGKIPYTGKPPSDWQSLLLRTLGVDGKNLSNAQAYFLIGELLELRGISYLELTWFLKNQKKPSLLPLIHYGIELEGNVKDKNEFREALTEKGIVVTETGYTGGTRAANEWRISADSSVSMGNKRYQPIELVSPKLLGYRGFLKLKQVLEIWNEVGADYVKSAGTHIHLDMYEVGEEFKKNLLLVWAAIEIPYMWYLVSSSRRNNVFCRAVTDNVLNDAYEEQISVGRYYSINFDALQRHGTVEFRLFNCTTDWKKVTAWTTLVLRIYDAVKNGFTYRDVPGNDFPSFLDKIGFGENACQFLGETKEYLIARYNHFKEEAEKHPEKVPNISPPAVVNGVSMARIREIRKLTEIIEKATAIIRVINTNRNSSWYWFNERLNWMPECQQLYNIAKGRTNKIIDVDSITLLINNLANPDNAEIPALSAQVDVNGRRVDIVTNEDGSLIPVCGCSYARRNSGNEQYCYHARYAARYIIREMAAEKIRESQRKLEILQNEENIDEISTELNSQIEEAVCVG